MLFCLHHPDKQIQNVSLDVKSQDRNVLCEQCLFEDNHVEILHTLPDFIQQTNCSDRLQQLKKNLLTLNETVQEQKEFALTIITSSFSDLKLNISKIIDQSEAEVRSHLWDNVESFRGIFSKLLQEIQESYHITLKNKKSLIEWTDNQINLSSFSQSYDKADNNRKIDTLRSLIRMESQKLPHLEKIHKKLEEAEVHSRLNQATSERHFNEAAGQIKSAIKGIYSKITETCLKPVDIEVHTEPPCLNYRSVFDHSICSVQLLHTIYAHSSPISSIISLNNPIPYVKETSQEKLTDKFQNKFDNNEYEGEKQKEQKQEMDNLELTLGQFISTSWDGLIKVWAVNEKQPIVQIKTFNGGIVAAALVDTQKIKNNKTQNPDMNSKSIAACSYYDSSIELVDISVLSSVSFSNTSNNNKQPQKRILGRIQPQEKIINSIINKDDLVICGCSSSVILSVPIDRFSEQSSTAYGMRLNGHSESVTCLSDMSCLSASVFVSTGADKLINLWDLRMDQPLKSIYSPHAANHVSQINPYLFVVSSHNSMLKIMDVRMFKDLLSFYGHRDAISRTAGFFPNIMNNKHSRKVDSNLNSSLHSMFVSAGNDNLIKVWNPFEKQALRFTLKGHSDVVWALEVDPLNSLIYSGDRNEEIKIWEYSI